MLKEPPEIYIRNPQETKVMEGMPLTLEGKARGWPYPSISWSRNKKVLAVNRTILILFNATESFNGEYTFTAENPLGTKYVTIKVAVVGECLIWLTD